MKHNFVLFSAGILALCPAIALANPTFTFGPASKYSKTSAAVTATGSNLVITPKDVSGGIPSGGIDFVLGPDQQSSLKTAASGVCKNGASQDCLNTVAGIIDNRQTYALQSRIVGIDDLFGLAIVGLISAVILGSQLDKNPPQAVHFESSDLVQIQSQTKAPYVFVTKSGSPPISITSLATPTVTASAAAITTLAADANGHHKGDIVVKLPTEPAQLMLELFGMHGGHDVCKNKTSSKRGTGGGGAADLVAISDAAQFVLLNADPHGALAGLGLAGGQALPQLANAANQAALGALQLKAAGLSVFAGVAADLTNVIAETVFIAAFDFCANAVSDLSELVLEEWFYDEDNNDNKSCPKDASDFPDCLDAKCVGDGIKNGTEMTGGRCTTGDQKGCTCLGSTAPNGWSYGGQDLWSEGQAELSDMLSGANNTSSAPSNGGLTCGTHTDMGNANNYVDLGMINNAANFFCQQQINAKLVLKPGVDDKLVELNYNNHLYDPVYVSLAWKNGPGCPTMDFTASSAMDTCKARFGRPINGCDTSNPSGYYWWKQGGSLDQDCVTWTIKRDTWAQSRYLGPVKTDPNWKPQTNTCKVKDDCGPNTLPAACQTQLGGYGFCRFDSAHTDLGWCECP